MAVVFVADGQQPDEEAAARDRLWRSVLILQA